LQNANAILEVAKHASIPLWAEAQLIAGEAMAYVGQYTEAQRLAYQARNKSGSDPEIYVGMITNPKAVYDDYRLIIGMAAQKYHDAYQASVDALEMLSQEQGDNLQWQVDIEAMQAHALWAIGDLEGAVTVASQCLRGSQQIESAIGPGRLNTLYIQMVQSGHGKQPKVREFGEMLLSS
jgi:tetratricopeptide (TPR) repeat protein